MNNFKVRAWDKISKKYRQIDCICFHGPGCFDYGPHGELKLVNMWGEDIIDDKPMIIRRESKDVDLEWWIGRVDINGVDVYSGDMVRCTAKIDFEYGGAGLTCCDVVAFHGGRFYVKGFFSVLDWEEMTVEVVGNIHQENSGDLQE